MQKGNSVKVLCAAMEEGENGSIILRGVIDPQTLEALRVGEYQREVLPLGKIMELQEAIRTSKVPDIELGVRGGNFECDETGAYVLCDPVFVIDGQQRLTAARRLYQEGTSKARLGATIHFNTTEEWEMERFKILNTRQTRVSPNIMVRNMRSTNVAIDTLFRLSSEKDFVLCGRISWSQRMRREELITALIFAKTIGALHSHVGPGLSSGVEEIGRGLEIIQERVGKNIFRGNVKAFFDLVDSAWGIKIVTFKEGATHLRLTFLVCLALLLARHADFWKGGRLSIEKDLARKIAQFPIQDPSIKNLASSAGQASKLLYAMLLDHVNSGKRTRHLTARQIDQKAVRVSATDEALNQPEAAAA